MGEQERSSGAVTATAAELAAAESLPSETLELTRRAFVSANSDDYEAMTAFFDADSVWDVWSWGLGRHAGPRAIRTFFESWIGGFDEFTIELEELVDVGNDVIFAVAVQTGRPAGGRGYIRLRAASIWLWEQGVARTVTHYRDVEAARQLALETAQSKK